MIKLSFLKSKIAIFIMQIIALSLLIYLVDYNLVIQFDDDISNERKEIIQFLANLIMFDAKSSNINGLLFIYLAWFLIALIPIFIFHDPKKAYPRNLTSFFFPNFFFYIFLSRYSPDYFDSHFSVLFTQTIILGIFIMVVSIVLSYVLKEIIDNKDQDQIEDLMKIADNIKSKCPHCGTLFESTPVYCYNCSKEIIILQNNEV